jgi:transcriptional regulator
MYQPTHFREDRLEVQHALITSEPFGLLISTHDGEIMANGLPFHLDASVGSKGKLTSHMAKANAQWRALDGQNVLIVFQGPQTYISPSLYDTKKETGKVVPTWNYAMVQVRGQVKLHHNAEWLLQQVNTVTKAHEQPRPVPWAVNEAPDDYIASQLKGIVGLEIEIAGIEGKWKVSQNRPAADRAGVVAGLETEAGEMAELVERFGRKN